MSIETGTRLGQYEVQELIGQGAMGVVYKAYHVQLARTGAVKFLRGITADADTIARFRREAQAIAQMRHPNILNVFDFGEYEGTPYMIAEYVPGGSLAGHMRQEPIDRASALRYLRGIAAGLDYAHSLGIVHRDVKPANVLLEKDGTPVIADFGLVKLLQATSLRSMTGATTGTPAYMAPEQVTGSQIGPAADRYSLATIAYEMLSGAIPFEGEGLMEVLYAQVHREPPLPSERVPELGPRVDAVIMRGLNKDPDARWESCEAFVTALGQALASSAPSKVEQTVVMAPPAAIPAAPRRESAEDHSPSSIAAEAPALARPSRRRLWAVAAVAVVLLLLLMTVGAYALNRQRPTLSLSASTVRPGDTLTVSASGLPAKQAGEVRLNSPIHLFAFRADSNGDTSVQLTVPADIGIGDHIIRLCWNSTCRLQATLHVVDTVAQTTPSPNATPIQGTTPRPTPSAKPSGRPAASPTSNPTRPPSPSPKATPTPSPPPASISISPGSGPAGSTVTVSGLNFSPGTTATVYFIQPPLNANTSRGTKSVDSAGSFTLQITIPLNAVVGSATIKTCDSQGHCATKVFNVTLT